MFVLRVLVFGEQLDLFDGRIERHISANPESSNLVVPIDHRYAACGFGT